MPGLRPDNEPAGKVCIDDPPGSEHQFPAQDTLPPPLATTPDLDPFSLPTDPGPAWTPDKSVQEWAACLWDRAVSSPSPAVDRPT